MAEIASAAGIAHALKGMDFPANKDDLVEHAKKNEDVSDDIIQAIESLPEQEYQSMADVEHGLHEEKSGGRSGRSSSRASGETEREREAQGRGSGSYSSGSAGESEREADKSSSRRSGY